MKDWINRNRKGIELGILALLLLSKEWTIALVLGILWLSDWVEDDEGRN